MPLPHYRFLNKNSKFFIRKKKIEKILKLLNEQSSI